ncbi:MAG: hypothetical protein COB24_09645 [Hyphomicrobiales bacterium]|nr:MAG: hypothetical protein COB24_09645 [Hyphomicrobiales bacterium]
MLNPLYQNTGFLLSMVAAQATKIYEDAVAEMGLNPLHIGLLEIVAAQQPIVQSRIAEQLAIFKPVIVTLVNELEAKSLVQRQPHPTDKRAFEIHLQPKGAQILAKIHQASATIMAEFLSTLNDSEQKQFHASLIKLSRQKN